MCLGLYMPTQHSAALALEHVEQRGSTPLKHVLSSPAHTTRELPDHMRMPQMAVHPPDGGLFRATVGGVILY